MKRPGRAGNHTGQRARTGGGARLPLARGLALAAAFTTLVAALPALANLRGVAFPEQIRRGETVLELRNASLLRYRYVFDVYVAGLYLEPDATVDRLLDPAVARRLEIHYLRGFRADQFRRSALDGVRRNVPPDEFERLRPELDAFNALFRDVQAGDRYALTYLPGSGTELSLNGESLGRVPGGELARALFSIWFGPDPFDAELKRELLGPS